MQFPLAGGHGKWKRQSQEFETRLGYRVNSRTFWTGLPGVIVHGVIPALGRQRKMNLEFKAYVFYIMNSRTAKTT